MRASEIWRSLFFRMFFIFNNEENQNFIGGKTMYWKIVAFLALLITFFGGLLMLTPHVFLGAIVLTLGIVLLVVSMATPEKW